MARVSHRNQTRKPETPVGRVQEFLFDHNLYYDLRDGGEGAYTYNGSWSKWRGRGNDAHSLFGDPQFVDPLRYDFRLKPTSPALKLGFKPIHLTQVGPRRRSELSQNSRRKAVHEGKASQTGSQC
jgi:hypothetical protein